MIMKAVFLDFFFAVTSNGNCKPCDIFTAPHQYEAKLPPCLIKHHAVETYGRLGLYLLEFITSALETGEKSASRPGRFTLREIFPSIH
jgi:hypothetical protein